MGFYNIVKTVRNSLRVDSILEKVGNMKIFKNLFAAFALLGLAASLPAFAAGDVSETYWASAEINEMVSKNVMTLDEEGNFNPEDSVKRGDFVKMLTKTLGHNDLEVQVQNPYTDINALTENFDAIMKSEELGLVYGYPDKTFRPENKMIKAEVTSVMSHITKNLSADEDVLSEFEDTDLIPVWAKDSYSKAVKLGLYVNYPDSLKFEPKREITRAETAVLLAKLSKALGYVKEEYIAPETLEKTLGEEHLNIHKDAESNIVMITNTRKIINSGNILKAEFANVYKSKNSNEGDDVVFRVRNDVVTDEGTTVIPANTRLYASVEDFVKPRWFNKNGEVRVRFTRLEMPDGRTADVNGYIYNNRDGYLKENWWKKVAAWTVGGAAVGIGSGLAIGIPEDKLGTGLAIGAPVGAGAGAVVGLVTKGVNYTAREGETVFIKLLDNVVINEDL